MYMESRRIQKAVKGDEDLQFCYSMLNRVSRSFSIVIQMLPESLRDPICIFYLTLRALDTVEDDMALPNERKLPLLHTFHDKLKDECAPTRPLQQLKLVLLRVPCSARSLEPTMGVDVLFKLHCLKPRCCMSLQRCYRSFHVEECGEKNYKELLEQYPKVTRVYMSLEPRCQEVIKDICHRMGVGMAEFIEKEVVTVEDYDLYCHYVAGVMRAVSDVRAWHASLCFHAS